MKVLIFTVCVGLFDLGVAQTIHAQKQIANSSTEATNNVGSAQQDGLNGQVRRVRVETISLLVRDGKTVEGPPVVRGITTFDPMGRKIDSVAYPADERTVVGTKQQYLYNDKGNITEMVMRGDDGSILNKVKYDYQFDEFGNWKKMTASIAIYESGRVGYEPFEITNRIITYYYGQLAPKATTASTVPQTSNKNTIATASGPAEIAKPANHAPIKVAPSGISAMDTQHTRTATDATVLEPEKIESSSSAPAAVSPKEDKLPTIRMSEEALRNAAIDLPQPQYPEAARLSGAEGSVGIQVLIDEKGEVLKASAVSGDPLFTEVAAEAARKAKFSRAKLSPEPVRIYGVINYTFNLPDTQQAALPTANATLSNPKTNQTNPGISDLKILQPGESVETEPLPEAASLTPAASFYEKGLEFLASGKHSEAVEALKQATNLDPNNAAAYAKLGIAYAAARQYKEAIAVMKIAIRIKPEMVDAEAYYHFSSAYSGVEKFSDALKAIKQAIYIKRAEQANPETETFPRFPTLADLHYSAGLAYFNLRRYRDAIEELKQVIALNPKSAQAYYGLALSYIVIGDRKSAQKQQATLESLDPAYAAKVAKYLSTTTNNTQQGFGFVFKNDRRDNLP